MDTQVLKVVGQVAGIAGIALGIFLLLFREVIRKNIFPVLTKTDSYRLMRLILVLVWSVALAGIIAYVYLTYPRKQNVLIYRGSVRDTITKFPISGATVSMLGRPDIASKTTDDKGNFAFTLETATGNFEGKAQVTHSKYEVWDKLLSISNDVMEEILLHERKSQDSESNAEAPTKNVEVKEMRPSTNSEPSEPLRSPPDYKEKLGEIQALSNNYWNSRFKECLPGRWMSIEQTTAATHRYLEIRVEDGSILPNLAILPPPQMSYAASFDNAWSLESSVRGNAFRWCTDSSCEKYSDMSAFPNGILKFHIEKGNITPENPQPKLSAPKCKELMELPIGQK